MNDFAAVEGSGSHKVLVLHGWALDSSVWLATRALSNQKDLTYAYYDFPGYGVNQNEAPASGMEGMVKAAMDAVGSLGWEKFSVLGHSMGGAAALRLATLMPDQVLSVAALTPVSPAGTALDAETYDAFRRAWADPAAAIKGSLSPNMDPEDLRRLVDRNRATMNEEVWSAYLANWTGPDFMDELGSHEIPTTLLYGESDPFVTADYLAETVAKLRKGTIRQLPKAGHYPMIENPGASVAAWEGALTGTATSQAQTI